MEQWFLREREQFPVLERKTYLDTATTGPLHREVYEAAHSYLQQRLEEGAGIEAYKGWVQEADSIRKYVAGLIGAEAEEIAFTKNASEGMNIAAHLIPFQPGDNVVVPDISFPSNAYAFMNLSRAGVETRLIPSREGQVPVEEILARVDARTRAISVCLVEFGTGFCHDVRRLGAFCRQRGIYFHVDATQAVGAMEVDVTQNNIDFLSFSAYKWLCCPLGVGAFYCRKEHLDLNNPLHAGWFGVRERFDFSELDLDLAPGARRFESGGLNYAGVFALGAASQVWQRLGIGAIEDRIFHLVEYLIEQLQGMGVEMLGPFPPARRGGIVYIRVQRPQDLRDALERAGVCINVGQEKARISPHFFNSVQDIDRLLEVLSATEARR